MRYCVKCLNPDTRPGIVFSDDGMCLPCQYRETFDRIDWYERRRELEELCVWAKAHTSGGYDCIIPVSGGKDSHRQALYMRDEMSMRPLLVSCAYPPEHQTERGARNLANLISLGFDCHVVSPAPKTYKKLMLTGLRKFGNFYKSTELALHTTGPKLATLYKIPLVVYGENSALQWGSAGVSRDGNANKLKYSNTLSGGDLKPYLEDGFEKKEMYWYRYPSDSAIARAELRLIFLGYYLRDFNDHTNATVALAHGLEPRTGVDAQLEDIGQINPFDALDDDFVQVNQMLKYFKFGFGKALEQASGAVRFGMLTRERAVELSREYDGRCAHRYIKRLCDYLEISEDEFWDIANSFRNPTLWEREGNHWRHRFPPK